MAYLSRQESWQPREGTAWRDYAVDALAGSVESGLSALKFLSRNGDVNAGESLAQAAITATEAITKLADPKPERFKQYAQRQLYWPVLKSFHKHFDVDHKKILNSLAVGELHPLNVYKGKWNARDGVGKFALSIWRRFDYLRQLKYPFGYELWGDAERQAHQLAVFGPATWRAWASVARLWVEENHKTPAEIRNLNALVKADSRKIPSYKIRSTTRISSHFFTMLKDKFRSMAGGNRD